MKRFYVSFLALCQLCMASDERPNEAKNFTLFGKPAYTVLNGFSPEASEGTFTIVNHPFLRIAVNAQGIIAKILGPANLDELRTTLRQAFEANVARSGEATTIAMGENVSVRAAEGDEEIVLEPGTLLLGVKEISFTFKSIVFEADASPDFTLLATTGSVVFEMTNPGSVIKSLILKAQDPSIAFCASDPRGTLLSDTEEPRGFYGSICAVAGSFSGVPTDEKSLDFYGIGALEVVYNLPVIRKLLEQQHIGIRTAADHGDAQAAFTYGTMLLKGDKIQKNPLKAAHYFQIAADSGHAEAQNVFASMLYKGTGVNRNIEEAIRYFQMSAAQNYPAAISTLPVVLVNYGAWLYNGDQEGIPQDTVKAKRYLEMAEALGDSDAADMLARIRGA